MSNEVSESSMSSVALRSVSFANPGIDLLSVQIKHERELREELAKRLDERSAANDLKVAAAFNSAERAIEKAERAQQAHNTASNEWRGTLDDHAKRQFPRTEADALEKKIDDVNKWLLGSVFMALLSLFGATMSIIMFLLNR